MIISASRRTDIPAFFGDWFANRIREGYFYRVNPYNSNQVKSISLRPEDVDCIVFWTKNPGPFIQQLDLLDKMGYRYFFHYTLNDYPLIFEPLIPGIQQRLDTFKALSEQIGPERVIWRYDPIIISSLTPPEYHVTKIMRLSRELQGYTHRLIISFLDFYGKVRRRLQDLTLTRSIQFNDFMALENRPSLHQFCREIGGIATAEKIQVFTCAEAIDLDQYRIFRGSCIDAALIKEVFGIERSWKKDTSQRDNCRCVESVDMGVYNTCRCGCIYCYANTRRL